MHRSAVFSLLAEPIFCEEASFGIGKYIALDKDFREYLLCICDCISDYISDPKRINRPLNIYLEAQPGSGKSFLVRQICKAISEAKGPDSIEYIECNLTQLEKPNDLNDIFIKTQSAYIEKRTAIVFFDELDARLNNNKHAFPYFLMPMFDGRFIVNNHIHSVGPGIFFYASSNQLKQLMKGSTEDLVDIDDGKSDGPEEPESVHTFIENEKRALTDSISNNSVFSNTSSDIPEKLLDFINRLDMIVHIPPLSASPNESLSHRFLQGQYITSAAILKYHPEAVYAEKVVVDFFSRYLIQTNNYRLVESLISRSSQVQVRDRVFWRKNLPFDAESRFSRWLDETQKELNASQAQENTKGTNRTEVRLYKIGKGL
jgi:hypothetical protein